MSLALALSSCPRFFEVSDNVVASSGVVSSTQISVNGKESPDDRYITRPSFEKPCKGSFKWTLGVPPVEVIPNSAFRDA